MCARTRPESSQIFGWKVRHPTSQPELGKSFCNFRQSLPARLSASPLLLGLGTPRGHRTCQLCATGVQILLMNFKISSPTSRGTDSLSYPILHPGAGFAGPSMMVASESTVCTAPVAMVPPKYLRMAEVSLVSVLRFGRNRYHQPVTGYC